MENLNIYNAMRKVPEEALREIKGGKLKGKSDINPMWRIKAMTEQFGPCGVGWKPELVRSWTEPGAGGRDCGLCGDQAVYQRRRPVERSHPGHRRKYAGGEGKRRACDQR